MRNWFLLAAALLCTMTASAADATGKWTGPMPTRNGETRETTFDLKSDGAKLTGTMSGRQGATEISDGKVSGDDIAFKVKLEFNGNAVVLTFKGKVSGDQIQFTRGREGADQTQQFTAKKAN